MRKLFTLFLALVASGGILFADESKFHLDFLYYDLIDATHEAYVVSDGGLYIGPNDVIIPDTVDNGSNYYAVTRIKEAAFAYSTDLVNITIPATVTTIEDNAFFDCDNLLSVTIKGEGLKTIGAGAFIDCDNMNSINFPENLETIKNNAFAGTQVKKVVLPSTIKLIGENAFEEVSSIWCKAAIPPDTDADAFHNTLGGIPVHVLPGKTGVYSGATGWSGFTNYIDQPALNDVFAYAYKGDTLSYRVSDMSDIKGATLMNDGDPAHQPSGAVVIPNTVTDWYGISYRVNYIADQVFEGNKEITSLDLSETQYITTLPFMMCRSCSNLSAINLSDKITAVYSYALGDCPLTTLDLKNVITIQTASFTGNALSELVIPKALTDICSQTHLFRNLTSLTCDPENPKYIAFDNAIYNKDTTEIVAVAGNAPQDLHIPVTVTSAASSALQGFQKTVYFNSEVAMNRSWTNSPSGDVVVGCGLLGYYTSGNFVGDNNSFDGIKSLSESLLWSVTATTEAGGSVAILDTTNCNEVRIEATPASGYVFVNWDNGETVNPLTVVVENDTAIKANFAQVINAINATLVYPKAGEVAGTNVGLDWEGEALSAGYTVLDSDGTTNINTEILAPVTNYFLQISFYPREGYLFGNDVAISVNGAEVTDKLTANVEQQTIRLAFSTAATGLEEIVNYQSSNRKLIKDGQFLILRDGKIYNALGVEVR